MGASVFDETRTAGIVGQYLKERLSPYDLTNFNELSFADQISFVYKPSWGGLRPTPLARAALSYLCAKVPVQVYVPPEDLRRLAVYSNPIPQLEPIFGRPDILVKRRDVENAFPYKAFPQALTKANVYLDEVGRDLWRLDRNFCYEIHPYLKLLQKEGVTHDRACAFVLYAWCVRGQLDDASRWAAGVILRPDYAKEVSNFIKAIGTNGSALGAVMVEADTLQGRGTGDIDLVAEAKKRISLSYIKDKMLAEFDEERLRQSVRKILQMEVKLGHGHERVDFQTWQEHWDSRWAWAVNGSHSSRVDQWVRPGYVKHPDIFRYHRRAWLEEIEDDPRPRWDGTTYVSGSKKLEAGKTRAIFACDTVSYLAFEHLMGPVEKVWRGERVVLNPGKGGHLGMAERVARNRARSGISLMLDYDDFNSHHSLSAMKLVIDELVAHTGYDRAKGELLIDSLEKQEIYVGGRYIGRAAGTLMSGHRCTTFFNSVLNMAYLMCVLGDDWLFSKPSLHVGDDVYLGVKDYQEAGHVVEAVMNSRLRMNPRKQSVGHVSTEFLRVASAGRASYGYLARAIGSLVSGNWASDAKLNPFEALTTMLASARTLANRSSSPLVPLLLRSSVKRALGKVRLDDSMLDELLCGGLAVNNGPVFKSSGTYRYVEIRPTAVKRDKHGYAPLKIHATKSYLNKCATELEQSILQRAGVSVVEDMEKSSYSKTLRFDDSYFETLTVSEVLSSPAVGSVSAESLLRTPSPRGLLTEYPLLVLAKNRIPERLVREALALAGGDPNTRNLELDAWGEFKHGCIVNTVLSYSDAATLGKRTRNSVLTSTRKCYV